MKNFKKRCFDKLSMTGNIGFCHPERSEEPSVICEFTEGNLYFGFMSICIYN